MPRSLPPSEAVTWGADGRIAVRQPSHPKTKSRPVSIRCAIRSQKVACLVDGRGFLFVVGRS